MSKIKKSFGFIGLVPAMFMGALDATIVNIALPDIMKDLNTSLTDTSWVATIYVLAMAVFIITASKLADLYGRRLVMLIGVTLFGVFSFACMTANSLSLLIVFRFFQGIGGAILTPIVLPMGIALFGKSSTSKVTAIMGAFSALAAAGGPVIGGLIIHLTTYHWIFGINVPIAILAFLLILWGNEESYDFSIAKEIDWLGMLFLTCTLGGLTFGLLEGREYGWTSAVILLSFVISLIGLILLIVVEGKVKSPIIELSLFKEKTFTASSIIYMIFGLAIIVPSLILNYFLQNVRNYSALHSAYLIVPASLAIVVGMPLATKMYQKLTAKLLICIGMFITAGGLFMLSLVQYATSKSIIICCNVVIGLGLGFMAMALTASVKYLPVTKAGIGSGIVNASRYIGQAIGMALLITILNANINTAKDNIRHDAYVQIDKHNLSSSVKKVAKTEIKQTFKSSNSTTDFSTKQSKMIKKIKAVAKETDNLPTPKKGSNYRKLYDANNALVTGTEKVVVNLPQQLSSSLLSLGEGQVQLGLAIQLLAQKEELTDTFKQIKDSKNKNLSQAFDQVFVVGSLIVLLSTPLAYLTDKKR
ncbi:MFS transporter [Streptococcus gallolyticus subsp. gallolyticus]|uniref:Permease of the major facilitator superfamily n=1 Tax=Streptococcus gallolyticus (strain UCN34) TaxID=637909 RepID=A0AA36K0C3_STRG3|nr:MFS transporter [Streptococcus gallolyticus]KJE98721.1 MFS transporter permease [Streptococcus gallolyticus subsp. gallolyticus]MCY7158539.1 MFS transporter [Streptococcus gallolyticus subsp. gallolyticus]MCY7164805.1 MFS transporter [Streptococcus gallolyticus subsp. gallolyticus]MCY7183624.1 MFS transporter [Streptococcus gallolyticus subsp. gallolyticus]CBI14559.1 putative permease of the major facilitator superfamily [Streptococcus gallolyticus UCN34]